MSCMSFPLCLILCCLTLPAAWGTVRHFSRCNSTLSQTYFVFARSNLACEGESALLLALTLYDQSCDGILLLLSYHFSAIIHNLVTNWAVLVTRPICSMQVHAQTARAKVQAAGHPHHARRCHLH